LLTHRWGATPCGAALPLAFKYEPLLAEMLFSQMLRVPEPEFKSISYFSIMVDLCKLMQVRFWFLGLRIWFRDRVGAGPGSTG
jgi:hypothetical protein